MGRRSRAGRAQAPQPPSIAQLARTLGMTEDDLRYMGQRYRAFVLGEPMPTRRAS